MPCLPVKKIVSRFENDYWPLRPYEATITCNIVIIVLVFVFYGLWWTISIYIDRYNIIYKSKIKSHEYAASVP